MPSALEHTETSVVPRFMPEHAGVLGSSAAVILLTTIRTLLLRSRSDDPAARDRCFHYVGVKLTEQLLS
jgi:hypothetical protein